MTDEGAIRGCYAALPLSYTPGMCRKLGRQDSNLQPRVLDTMYSNLAVGHVLLATRNRPVSSLPEGASPTPKVDAAEPLDETHACSRR